MTDREQDERERDLEQFAALAPTLGGHAVRETPIDVTVGVDFDPAIGDLVATTIVDGGWWLDGAVGVPWIEMLATTGYRNPYHAELNRAIRQVKRRRRRIAMARKARRGWR